MSYSSQITSILSHSVSATRKLEATACMSYRREPANIDILPIKSATIVGIDGDNGAGKTYLGKELAYILGGEHIEIDKSLAMNGAPYLQQINQTLLTDRLQTTRSLPVIVDGIILLDVFDALEVTPDYFIFAKCYINGQREQERYLSSSAKLPKSQTSREIAMYYRKRRPWLEADLVVTLHMTICL